MLLTKNSSKRQLRSHVTVIKDSHYLISAWIYATMGSTKIKQKRSTSATNEYLDSITTPSKPDTSSLISPNGKAKDNTSLDNVGDAQVSDESEFEIEDLLSSSDEFVYDEDDIDDDAQVMLSHPIEEKEQKHQKEGNMPDLDYTVMTMQDIFENMLGRVDHLQPIFNIPREDILLLMQHYDWNEERLLENWTEKMDELLVEIGVTQDTGSTPHVSAAANETSPQGKTTESSKRGVKFRENFTCLICCEEKNTETFSLECGHEFCIDCYRHYIEDKLHSGNIITCMNCSLALKNYDIDNVMGHESSKKLMASSIKSFIQSHNKNYKWCPYADCGCIIHLRDTSTLAEYTRLHYSPFVKCNNDHRFCFSCGFEVHAPADCNVTNAWIKKARKESENLNWVVSHTKECPKCGANIEKDGGCNHMKCFGCKYEFCWICDGEWAPHGKDYYQCVMYNNEDNPKKSRDANLAKYMKKYTFYYRIFNEHELSAKLDWKLGQTIESKVRELQEQMDISWIEGQFLPDSIRILNESRTALKWSFPVSYYSDQSHNLTKIFVDNQSLLSKAVEDLSELLQIKDPIEIMRRKADFYNMSGFVENRKFALMECGRELLCRGICKPMD